MRLLFNSAESSSYDFLMNIRKIGIDVEPFSSNVEHSYNFTYKNTEFILLFDPHALVNPRIFKFICESYSSNDGEENENDRNITKELKNELKKYLEKITTEDD